MTYYFYLFFAILLTVGAQLTLKHGATKEYHGIKSIINFYNATAYSLLLIVTILTVKALQGILLSVATAWISLTYMLVAVASAIIFNEGGVVRKLTACALISIGVIMFEAPALHI